MPSRTRDYRLLFGGEHAREIFAIYASLRHTAEGCRHGSLVCEVLRGLDVHQSSITACVLIAQTGKPLKHIRRFGSTTREHRELVAWLREFAVEHVATESTGVYWKPVWNVLEDHFQIIRPTRNTSRQFPDARRARRIVSGSLSCYSIDSCVPATSQRC